MMNTNGISKFTKGRARTSYSPQFKAQVVLEVLTGTKTVSEACRAYNLKYESLNRWRNHFMENADQLFQTEGHSDAEEARVAELERVIGRLTLELEIAKKASSQFRAHLQRRER